MGEYGAEKLRIWTISRSISQDKHVYSKKHSMGVEHNNYNKEKRILKKTHKTQLISLKLYKHMSAFFHI